MVFTPKHWYCPCTPYTQPKTLPRAHFRSLHRICTIDDLQFLPQTFAQIALQCNGIIIWSFVYWRWITLKSFLKSHLFIWLNLNSRFRRRVWCLFVCSIIARKYFKVALGTYWIMGLMAFRVKFSYLCSVFFLDILEMFPRSYCQFADDIFKWIFLNENVWIPIKISLKFVPQGPINNIPALVQIMAWRRPGDKLLSGPMRVRLPTHICVTRHQWVKTVLTCVNKALNSPLICLIPCLPVS